MSCFPPLGRCPFGWRLTLCYAVQASGAFTTPWLGSPCCTWGRTSSCRSAACLLRPSPGTPLSPISRPPLAPIPRPCRPSPAPLLHSPVAGGSASRSPLTVANTRARARTHTNRRARTRVKRACARGRNRTPPRGEHGTHPCHARCLRIDPGTWPPVRFEKIPTVTSPPFVATS